MSGTSNPESASDPLSLEQLKLDAFRRMENHSPALMLPRLIMSQHLHQRMRAAIKRQINELLASEIVEEKSYQPY